MSDLVGNPKTGFLTHRLILLFAGYNNGHVKYKPGLCDKTSYYEEFEGGKYIRSQGYKTFFMLNSAEYAIQTDHKD